MNIERNFISDKKIVDTCSCGRPLYAVYGGKGKIIGVTHTVEDEDYHFQHWSTDSVIKKNRK